jgi:prevent-host-death family protein
MKKPAITTETMKISDVRSNINSLVNEVYRHEKRVIVEKSGIPVAAIVSLEDVRRIDQLDRSREVRFKIVDEIRAAFAGVPPEEIEREGEKAVAQVRAERRAAREKGASQE